jgi:hypothetical protein
VPDEAVGDEREARRAAGQTGSRAVRFGSPDDWLRGSEQAGKQHAQEWARTVVMSSSLDVEGKVR